MNVFFCRCDVTPNNLLLRKTECMRKSLALQRAWSVPLVGNGLDDPPADSGRTLQFIEIDSALLHDVGHRLKILCRCDHSCATLGGTAR